MKSNSITTNKQHYRIEHERATPRLNLVVIRSRDMETSKKFYELIGLEFQCHRHGNGEEHYASESETYVFEIYPERSKSSQGTRIGFVVPDVDAIVDRLRTDKYEIVNAPADSPWGRRAVLRDPDGHSVELVGQPI